MTEAITLTLPKNLVARLRSATSQLDVLLTDLLTMLAPVLEETAAQPPIDTLSDEAVLALATEQMDAVQQQRLEMLQTQGKTDTLTEAEQLELLALLHICQNGQRRKSEAMTEALNRNLIEEPVR